MLSEAMKDLERRATCPECGVRRIKPNPDTPYGLCPDGHGRLVSMRAKDVEHLEISGRLPEAIRVGTNKFEVEGRDGVYGYSAGSGVQAVDADDPLPDGWVIAYQYNGASLRVRAFKMKKPVKAKVAL